MDVTSSRRVLRIWVGHPESRAGLATVRGWNRVRAADLFEPTLPHNLGMPYGLETKNKKQQQQGGISQA